MKDDMSVTDDMRRAAEARRRGIPEWMIEMIETVPDHREVAAEFSRGVPEPSSIASKAKSEPAVRGSGWLEPSQDERSPSEIEIVDRICEGLIGGPNDTSKPK